jgi:hypothetical protein
LTDLAKMYGNCVAKRWRRAQVAPYYALLLGCGNHTRAFVTTLAISTDNNLALGLAMQHKLSGTRPETEVFVEWEEFRLTNQADRLDVGKAFDQRRHNLAPPCVRALALSCSWRCGH